MIADYPSGTLPAAPEAASVLDRELVMTAVANANRRSLLRVLAQGQNLGVGDASRLTKMSATLAGRQLTILKDAGLIEMIPPPDGDGRRSVYRILANFRSKDAAGVPVLDFGSVLLRLP